jgi:hypothetical protein
MKGAKERIQRYEWEDCLIEASTLKLIPKGWATTALRLSRQINWTPVKTQREPGLYWSNALAAKSVGIGQSTMYEHVKGLKQHGFLIVKKGNLVPRLPHDHEGIWRQFDQYVEQLASSECQEEGTEEQDDDSRTQSSDSTRRDTFTEDICTEDLCTEDLLKKTDASHPAHSGGNSGKRNFSLLAFLIGKPFSD